MLCTIWSGRLMVGQPMHVVEGFTELWALNVPACLMTLADSKEGLHCVADAYYLS